MNDVTKKNIGADELPSTEAEWLEKLGPEAFAIMRKQGTERAFTGEFWDKNEQGSYRCKGCGEVLFLSDTKFDSGCGWPSFFLPASAAPIEERSDNSHGMQRTEVVCTGCNSHLGHVFKDGPAVTGLRYCINSVCLDFEGVNGQD
jgi:peptide-methionine (R)-S-oxide reductase